METAALSVAYKINTPRVAHQTIDGETIIIDFDNGAYYSTDKAGAEIWELVAKGLPELAICNTLAQRYGAHAELADEVTDFLAELQRESLISPLAAEGTPPSAVVAANAPPPAAGAPIFEKPKLGKYTDMQDLLLADPIHEVDEQGWPVKQGANAG